MRNNARRWAFAAALGLGAACGGGDDGGTTEPPPPPPPVTVTVLPGRDTLTLGTSVQLTATVTGNSNHDVTWSVVGGAAAGTVSADGMYQAGQTPGLIRVVATSVATPVGSDTARILVVEAPLATVTAPDSAAQGAVVAASVPVAGGVTYLWTVTGGVIASGQGSAQVTVTAGGGSILTLNCVAQNLADSTVSGGQQVVLVPGPQILSFSAGRDTITAGEGTTLTATFANGTATIDQAIGTVASGATIPVGPFATGYAGTLFTLTVTGFRGLTQTAQQRVVSANPPTLNLFEVLDPVVPVGGHARFQIAWAVDPGVVATLEPDVGVITTSFVSSANLTTPGRAVFTVRIASPADSVISDTVSVQTVTPASGTFSAAGSLHEPRMFPTGTLLTDGRVLVTGGDQGTTSAEIYDPATNGYSMTGSMVVGRGDHVAALLPNGRVFVAGGNPNPTLGMTSEVFDPTTESWSNGPTLTFEPRAAVLLSGGQVLLIPTSGPAAIYDPVSGTVTPTGTVLDSSPFRLVVPLSGDRALIWTSTGQPQMQLYSLSAGLFTVAETPLQPHQSGSVSPLPDGRVLIVGGKDLTSGVYGGAEVFDPATGHWTVTGRPSTNRAAHRAVLLSDGRTLIAGGVDRNSRPLPYAEIYDATTGEFTPLLGTLGLSSTVSVPVAVPLANGAALFTGGREVTTQGGSSLSERFSP